MLISVNSYKKSISRGILASRLVPVSSETSMWFLACVLSVVVGGVYAQPTVSHCQDRCNLMLCMQNSENQVNRETNFDISLALGTACFNGACACNIGSAYYSSNRAINVDDDVCSPWGNPFRIKADVDNCAIRTGGNQVATEPNPPNHVETCLSHMNSTVLVPHFSRQCRYTLVLILNRDLANETEARRLARGLINKGVVIHCFLVGNPAEERSTVFNLRTAGGICTARAEPQDADALWSLVEQMYGQLGCCDPPVPTTTTTTTTTTTRAPTRPPVGPCDNCKIINGVGYINHWSRCDAWVRCVPDIGGTFRNLTNNCTCGFFWDQDLLNCLPASQVQCPLDPCRNNPNLQRYAYDANCNGYWVCEGGRTVSAGCCNPGESFNVNSQQCDPNVQCGDNCPCDVATSTGVCRFEPNPIDRFTYLEQVYPSEPPLIRSCPGGTFFVAASCGCHGFTHDPMLCLVDFDKSCDNDPLRDSGNDVYVANRGVTVNTNANECIFGGSQYLIVPRFSNVDFRDKLAIRTRFNGGNNQNNNAPLVLNSDCGEASTVSLKLGVDGLGRPVVRGSITTNTGTYTTSVVYTRNQWNDVYMAYDGQNLLLCIRYADGTTDSSTIPANGMVQRCKCALIIGKSEETPGNPLFYNGVTSRTRVWIQCIPQQGCPT